MSATLGVMPMYSYTCSHCRSAQERYIPATQDKDQPGQCEKCDTGPLIWDGLDRCHGKAADLHGAYDKQGRFYPGTFGSGAAALPKRRNIKTFKLGS